MSTPTIYFFGQGGNVDIGLSSPFTVCVKEWSSTFNFNPQDLTTTCSGGYRDQGTGIQSIDATFSGFYSPINGTLTDFCTGNVVYLKLNLGDSDSFITGNFLV